MFEVNEVPQVVLLELNMERKSFNQCDFENKQNWDPLAILFGFQFACILWQKWKNATGKKVVGSKMASQMKEEEKDYQKKNKKTKLSKQLPWTGSHSPKRERKSTMYKPSRKTFLFSFVFKFFCFWREGKI